MISTPGVAGIFCARSHVGKFGSYSRRICRDTILVRRRRSPCLREPKLSFKAFKVLHRLGVCCRGSAHLTGGSILHIDLLFVEVKVIPGHTAPDNSLTFKTVRWVCKPESPVCPGFHTLNSGFQTTQSFSGPGRVAQLKGIFCAIFDKATAFGKLVYFIEFPCNLVQLCLRFREFGRIFSGFRDSFFCLHNFLGTGLQSAEL